MRTRTGTRCRKECGGSVYGLPHLRGPVRVEVLACLAALHGHARLMLLSSAYDEALLGRKVELDADHLGATLWVALQGEGMTPNKFASILVEAIGGTS
jgi:hypothetical protein